MEGMRCLLLIKCLGALYVAKALKLMLVACFYFNTEPDAEASPARKSPGQMSSDTVQSNETADSAQVFSSSCMDFPVPF